MRTDLLPTSRGPRAPTSSRPPEGHARRPLHGRLALYIDKDLWADLRRSPPWLNTRPRQRTEPTSGGLSEPTSGGRQPGSSTAPAGDRAHGEQHIYMRLYALSPLPPLPSTRRRRRSPRRTPPPSPPSPPPSDASTFPCAPSRPSPPLPTPPVFAACHRLFPPPLPQRCHHPLQHRHLP